MIYPEKISAKKSNKIIKILMLASILFAICLIIINKATTPKIPWATLTNAGIVYIWVTVMYSISKNTNIAKHVLIQTIAISALTVYIDDKLGFKGWSLSISMPIIIIISNITMLILTLVTRKRFLKYAFYQILLVIISIATCVLELRSLKTNGILTITACVISFTNFAVSFILCTKDYLQIIIRKFHM